MSNDSKKVILNKIREALKKSTPLPFAQTNFDNQNLFITPSDEDNAIIFAEEFTKQQGKFSFCPNPARLHEQLLELLTQRVFTNIYCKHPEYISLLKSIGLAASNDLANCDASITDCEFLVARTGSIMLSAAQQAGRTASVYAPVHICIGYTSQLVYDIGDAFVKIQKKYGENLPSLISLATGPSRTADIEKTLVTGVHGPKEVYCFLVEDKFDI